MKLSIITINFNNLEGLKKTVESVINQTWKDFEWIFIDGGSTDGSKEYIVNLNDNLSHSGWNPITYWCSEPDKGIYNAMNKGIAKANGDYLNFMNSGDCFYENDTLEKVSAYLEKRIADIYYGNLIIVNGSAILERREYNETVDLYDMFFKGFGHQAQYFKTTILKSSHFDEKYKIFGDHAKNVELFMKGYVFKNLPLYVARFDGNGISSKCKSEKLPEMKKIEQDFLSDSILSVLLRLYKYENGHIYQRVNNIMDRGGLSSLILRLFLKIVGTKER